MAETFFQLSPKWDCYVIKIIVSSCSNSSTGVHVSVDVCLGVGPVTLILTMQHRVNRYKHTSEIAAPTLAHSLAASSVKQCMYRTVCGSTKSLSTSCQLSSVCRCPRLAHSLSFKLKLGSGYHTVNVLVQAAAEQQNAFAIRAERGLAQKSLSIGPWREPHCTRR